MRPGSACRNRKANSVLIVIRTYTWLFLAGLALAFSISCGERRERDILTPAERTWLKEHPRLRIAPDPNFAPVESFQEDGRYVGFMADMMSLLEKRLDVRFEIVRLPTWDDVVRQARARGVDGITAAQITPERRTFLLFTTPIVDIPNVIIVRSDTPGTFTLPELRGKRIVVTRGNAIHEHIAREFAYLEPRSVADDLACLLDVSFNRADATVVNLAIASYLIDKHGISNLRLAGDSGRSNPLAFACRSDWPVLQGIVEKGLAAISREERDALYRKWVSLRPESFFSSRTFWNTLIAVLCLTALLTAAGVAWNVTLRRRVSERTRELDKELAIRRQVEEDLRSQRERLAVTLRSIGDGVVVTDNEGNITLLNDAAEKLVGKTGAQLLGKPFFSEVCMLDPETRAQLLGSLSAASDTGSLAIRGGREILVAADGTERTVSDSVAPILDEHGTVKGAVMVLHDISEKEAVERELRNLQKLESLGILAGGLAHDFNNIMTAIMGNIALARLEGGELPQACEEYLAGAESAVERAKGLTQQLLTFSKGGCPVKSPLPLGPLLRENTQFVLAGSNVSCVFAIADDLPPVDIDEGQIVQVVCNLVINAKQAMPEGGSIRVQARRLFSCEPLPPALPPGVYVLAEVVDHGTGIPENILPHIFDPFFSTKETGHGLGLSMCRSIVEKHGGCLTVASSPGEGSTFSFYLPVAVATPAENQADRRVSDTFRARVLVMDDEESVRHIFRNMLSRLGHEPVCVADGHTAIAEWGLAAGSAKPFDVAIVDLTVPGGLGGKDTVAALREKTPGAKVLVTSGYSNDPVMADPQAYGFAGSLAKPFRIEELSDVLRATLFFSHQESGAAVV